MTATTSGRSSPSSLRQQLRFGSMEILGFTDDPHASSVWTSSYRGVAAHGRNTPGSPAVPSDPLTDWKPREVVGSFAEGSMRWGVLFASLLLVGIVLAIGFWAYQRPEAEAAEALTGVETAATALEEDLLDIRSLNEALLEQGQIGSSTASLLAVEGSARDLFAASGKLPASEADTRSVASRAASEALDASRLLGDATTFRSAVIPILAVPDFETQPGLISLDEAARAFGEWQAQFDSVRAALPENALASVASELELVSGNLESVQTRYLDALRRDDQWGAATAVNDLEAQLSQAEETMLLTLFEIHETVQVRVEKSLQDIESLLG